MYKWLKKTNVNQYQTPHGYNILKHNSCLENIKEIFRKYLLQSIFFKLVLQLTKEHSIIFFYFK